MSYWASPIELILNKMPNPTDRSTWVVQREYQDAQGIMQTEYRDSLGNIHVEATNSNRQVTSHTSNYVDGVLVEEHRQNGHLIQEEVADRKVSRGLLVGLIIAGVIGITGAVAYYLFEMNDTDPVTVVTTPVYKTDTDKTNPDANNPQPVVEDNSVTNITPPAEPDQAKPQDVNVTVKTEAPAAPANPQPKAAQPTKTATAPAKAPAQPNPAPAKVAPSPQAQPIAPMAPVPPPSNTQAANSGNAPGMTKTDSQLKGEIVQQFNKQFSGNQLSVDVSQGNVKVNGTVASPDQLDDIQPLLRTIEGVKTVDVKVTSKMSTN